MKHTTYNVKSTDITNERAKGVLFGNGSYNYGLASRGVRMYLQDRGNVDYTGINCSGTSTAGGWICTSSNGTTGNTTGTRRVRPVVILKSNIKTARSK